MIHKKNIWVWISLGLLCLLIVSLYMAATYYSEGERYKRLYEQYKSLYEKIVEEYENIMARMIKVNVLIDYGNGTSEYHNEILVQRDSTLFEVMKRIAKIDYITSEYGVFITHINGVGGETGKYWLWYFLNVTSGEWEMLWESCDKHIMQDGETVAWNYTASWG
ncbi:MAG: DUF4430 domain-containing protein [Candidatus Bathyarchaeia archaeon]